MIGWLLAAAFFQAPQEPLAPQVIVARFEAARFESVFVGFASDEARDGYLCSPHLIEGIDEPEIATNFDRDIAVAKKGAVMLIGSTEKDNSIAPTRLPCGDFVNAKALQFRADRLVIEQIMPLKNDLRIKIDLASGRIAGVEERDRESKFRLILKDCHLTALGCEVGANLTLANFASYVDRFSRRVQSLGDEDDASASYDHHQERPIGHLLLGLQIGVGVLLVLFGLKRIRDARHIDDAFIASAAKREGMFCIYMSGFLALICVAISIQ